MVRYDKSTADKGRRHIRPRKSGGNRTFGGRRSGGIGGGGARIGGGKAAGGGIGGLIIVLLLAFCTNGLSGGGDQFSFDSTAFDAYDSGEVQLEQEKTLSASEENLEEYMAFLMEDIQQTWLETFAASNLEYEFAELQPFTGSVDSGCGPATSAVGPFYCPAPSDRGVYIDLEFFNDLATDYNAPGDFAQAYVIAHEIGHHVQTLQGISQEVAQAKRNNPDAANELQVLQELQADCYAGYWAFSASQRVTRESGQPILEVGDLEEGLAAAESVGDDRLQQQAGVAINQESWTHGSAASRAKWFLRGFETGDPRQCDTFSEGA